MMSGHLMLTTANLNMADFRTSHTAVVKTYPRGSDLSFTSCSWLSWRLGRTSCFTTKEKFLRIEEALYCRHSVSQKFIKKKNYPKLRNQSSPNDGISIQEAHWIQMEQK